MKKRIAKFLFLGLLFCGQILLAGCSLSLFKRNTNYDRAPKVKPEVHRIHDAIPRVEPYHPYGRRDYKLKGKFYRVIKNAKGYVRYGHISWYGTQFHGRETATQERYNLYGMTAASPELPLPSYVEVTNLRNGKTVIVRVNDRGPYCRKRILDLSYAAALKLGYADHGVTYARVAVIDPIAWHKKYRTNARKKMAGKFVIEHKDVNNTSLKTVPHHKQTDRQIPRSASITTEASKNRDKQLPLDKTRRESVVKDKFVVHNAAKKPERLTKIIKTSVVENTVQLPLRDSQRIAKSVATSSNNQSLDVGAKVLSDQVLTNANQIAQNNRRKDVTVARKKLSAKKFAKNRKNWS